MGGKIEEEDGKEDRSEEDGREDRRRIWEAG